MKRFAAAIATVALLSTPALARELKGVTLAETANTDGQELKLTGAGVRNKWFFDVYVIGLYLADPAKDPLSDQAKQVKLVLLRDLSKEKIGDAIREGFEKNSAAEMPKLKDRLDKLIGVLTDGKRGDSLVLTYVPGTGTVVSGKGKKLTTIEGADFARALFSVWLGKNPVDEGLKNELLGKKE
ncbi:MAG: chalcone isomerase family protein [Myxococcaceae bacterium]|nr:chalcone isomerase family protein [Myxococcaceae bacterium]